MQPRRKKSFLRSLLKTVIIIAIISCYANFLHPVLFFSKPPLTNVDSSVLQRGIPVAFTSNGYQLKGRLLAPPRPSFKIPAIIFRPGSGATSSYASSGYPGLLKAMLEEQLPMDSMAVLYIDKRGVGASEGQWYNTTFEESAADMKAAAYYLSSLPYIDPHKIIIAGHSEGGWIVEVCLSRYPETFAGGLSLAGPTLDVKEQIIHEFAGTAICVDKKPREAALRKARIFVNVATVMSELFPFTQQWRQLAVTHGFKAAPYIQSIKKPVLFMFGENDRTVWADDCLRELQQIFPGGYPAHIDTVVLKGTNHRIRTAPACYRGSKVYPFSDEARLRINQWIRKVAFSQL
ncbi:prolyl oligopeptidase family serine peptidase [Chitinophaga sp. Mgbs1]|uniref:Prolyl oligopeptidase family serine peptidase n=1 Tax=Chitinophaga solisilvae TaxID=1233460 RepID=A0A3S1AYU4_9BACT|nr:prolyl oligopeptidase family serine peptidase [Chitinophaga solisilvae]